MQQSSGTSERIKAEEYEAKLSSSPWEQDRLGARPVYTWDDAVVQYVRETKHKAPQVSDIYHLRWLDKYLNGVELQTIRRDMLDKISAAKQAGGRKLNGQSCAGSYQGAFAPMRATGRTRIWRCCSGKKLSPFKVPSKEKRAKSFLT